MGCGIRSADILRLSFLLVRIVSLGITQDMQADVRIDSVEAPQTRSVHARYVVKDDSAREYTPCRPKMGAVAKNADEKRSRIEFPEQQRTWSNNVSTATV